MNQNNQRLMITVALCMVVALAWSFLFQPKHPVRPAQQAVTAPAATNAAPSPGADVPAAQAANVPRGTTAAPRHPTRKITLSSDLIRAVITSDGAALEALQLKGEKYRRTHEDKSAETLPVDLAVVEPGQYRPLSAVVRGSDAAAAALVPADASYDVVSEDAQHAVLKTESNGVTVKKTFTLDPASYKLGLAVEVTSATALTGALQISYDAKSLPEGQGGGGMFSRGGPQPSQATCAPVGKSKPEKLAPNNKHPSWDGQTVAFAGVDEQYFLAAIVPAEPAGTSCRIVDDPKGTVGATVSFPLTVAPGGSATKAMAVYAGPKETDALAAVSPALKDSVDLGFWWLIARVLLEVMKFFHNAVPPHNWGIAIILLTLTVKAITFPLQHKSMKSMQEMQRLQPVLDEMKKKYAGDQQRQNLEQMKLFKEHGVNPMGGCLPMLIQMPVWLALYTTLQVSVELYHSVFIPGWLNDLTAKDPYYILPVAMGATMFLTQYLTPTPTNNPSQKMMGYAMTAFFSFLMLSLPSGLTLYIFVNNVLSIVQQMYLRRTMGGPAGGGPAAAAVIPATAKRA